jgi:hypothetical protein
MSYWVAGAAVGSALIGAYSSNKASKDAAKGQEKGLAASNAMAQQAIGGAKDYFNIGQKSSQAGFQSALDFFKSSQPAKYNPMIQGNVAAQKVIGQGATQANNAILGLPVDMSFANQPQAIQPDYSAIQNAKLPVLGQPSADQSLPSGQQTSGQQNSPQQKPSSSPLTLGGYATDPRAMLNPTTAITNPLGALGLGDKVTSKLDPIKNTKKLLGKLF